MNDARIIEQLRSALEQSVRQAEERHLTLRYEYAWETIYHAAGRAVPAIEALQSRLEAYETALARIADFDVETETSDGFNEWGEAEAWGVARTMAEIAIGRLTDSCIVVVPDEDGKTRECGHRFDQHGNRWRLDKRTYCQGCYVTPPPGDYDHHIYRARLRELSESREA